MGITASVLVAHQGNAQPVERVVAERFGHEETARDAWSRVVPARDDRAARREEAWRDSRTGHDRTSASQRHRVVSGETLFRIAKRYGVTVEALQRANGIDDPTTLRIGQTLLIPGEAKIRSGRSYPAPESQASRPDRREHHDDWREDEPQQQPRARSERAPEPEDRSEPTWREQQERAWREREGREAAPRRRDTGGLRALARTMTEPAARRDGEMPAGYTFFAQLVAADLKVGEMLRGWLEEDGRARRVSDELDLDIVYGRGPEADSDRFYVPYIRTGPRLSRSGKRYALSRNMPPAGNVFVAQLQASFIELHNRAVDLLIERHLTSERSRYCEGDCSNAELARALPGAKRLLLFKDARETVIHYYHRIIVEDFLPRLIGPERTQDIISNGRDLFFREGFRDGESDKVKEPFLPYEFALAAYQFTASQIGPAYVMRDGQRARRFNPAAIAANRPLRKGMRSEDLADWRYFVDILPEPPKGFNFAGSVDPLIASSGGYWEQRRGAPNIAANIMLAGSRARLPEGQQVAEKLLPALRRRGLLYLWQPSESSADGKDAIWRRYILAPDRATRETLGRGGTPLFYYLLQEAEAMGAATEFGHSPQGYADAALTASARYAEAEESRGRRDFSARPDGGHTLGPVGGTIVGEVLIGLAEHYALKTGKGLGFKPPIARARMASGCALAFTRVRARNGDLGNAICCAICLSTRALLSSSNECPSLRLTTTQRSRNQSATCRNPVAIDGQASEPRSHSR